MKIGKIVSILGCAGAAVLISCQQFFPVPAKSYDLGSRSVPGYNVAMVQRGEAVSGEPLSFMVNVKPQEGGGEIEAVALRVGDEYLENSESVIATHNDDGTWTGGVTMPGIDPGKTRVWVIVKQRDGAILESGPDDFALKNE